MKQKNNFLFWLFGAVLIIVFFLAGGGQFAKGQINLALNAIKYQSSLAKINFWLNNFPEDIFQNPLIKQLEKPIALPLEIGAKGSSNPFRTPATPEELLKGGKKSL